MLSVEEFIERVQNGNRWVRLRELVLDINTLNKTHPGGRAVLDAGMHSTFLNTNLMCIKYSFHAFRFAF